jgi:iron complex transport system substrate-binding protein
VLDRRRFLLSAAGLAALAALPACGSQDGAATSGPAAGSATPSGESQAQFPRIVRHGLGETSIPARPERVVCGTDGAEMCALLALGVKPVGYGQREDPPRPWLAGLVDGLPSYDLSSGETSFERLAAYAPDLLLVQEGFATAETLPRFSEIAPTVATSFIDWRESLRQVAEAVGLDEQGRRLREEKDAFIQEAASRLPAAAKGLKLQALAAFDDGSVYRLNDASPLGKIAAALGLAPLPQAKAAGEAVDQLSLEQLSEADGDLLLLMDFGDGTDLKGLTARSVFQQLGVVKAGKVVTAAPDDANALYFDAVLTVEPNVDYLERVITGALP